MRALVVLSGGQDSTTCLYLAKREVEEVHCLTFDYQQRHAIEIEAASRIAKLAQVSSHEILTIPSLEGSSPLVNRNTAVEEYESAAVLPGGLEKTFVPARNLVFLAYAANRAAVLGCATIVLGVGQEDYGGYPDCRKEFIDLAEQTINSGLSPATPISVRTPLMNLSKRDTVRLALSLPGCMEALAYSHTCYNGLFPPCGHCHACLLRARGFGEAGEKDPLIERAKELRSV